MFSKLKTLFKKENPEASQKFDHSNISMTDATQCPFMNKKKQGQSCPYKNQQKQNNNDQLSQSQDQKPRGGCPFMGGNAKKNNPGLQIKNSEYDQPFVSKYKYYLSENKLDFTRSIKDRRSSQRVVFDTYPIYLQHSLFFQGQDFKKVRKFEICSRFLAYEQLREKGNRYYNKGKFLKALQYYERAASLFKWLEHSEQKQNSKMQSKNSSKKQIQLLQNKSEKSIGIGSQNTSSKINLNLSEEQISFDQPNGPNKDFDQLKSKYKEFFITYNDDNVVLFDGEDCEQQADVDMRKSLLLQVYLNMATTYINLGNYSLALKILQDADTLTDKVSQVRLRRAQALILNKGCTLQQAKLAKQQIEIAIAMKPNQKLFQNANENILKMLNLHNIDEVYAITLKLTEQTLQRLTKQNLQAKQKLYKRAKRINEVQKQIIAEGKVPKQSYSQEKLRDSTQYKILLRMKDKYIRVIQFYTEAKNNQQVTLARRQMQEILRIYSEIQAIFATNIEEQGDQLGGINTDKIKRRIQYIKTEFANDIYNTGKFNFSVLEWAIKQIVNQQHEQKKKEQKNKQSNEQQPIASQKKDWKYFATPFAIVLPLVAIAINYFLI